MRLFGFEIRRVPKVNIPPVRCECESLSYLQRQVAIARDVAIFFAAWQFYQFIGHLPIQR